MGGHTVLPQPQPCNVESATLGTFHIGPPKHMPPLWAHARPTNVPKSAQGGCTGTLGAMCAWVQPPATCVPTIESGHATMAPHMSDGWRCWPWPCTMGGPHARTQCLKGGWAYPEAHSQPVCQPGGTPKSGHNATLGTRPPRPPSTPVGGLGAHTCALPMCLEGLGGGGTGGWPALRGLVHRTTSGPHASVAPPAKGQAAALVALVGVFVHPGGVACPSLVPRVAHGWVVPVVGGGVGALAGCGAGKQSESASTPTLLPSPGASS